MAAMSSMQVTGTGLVEQGGDGMRGRRGLWTKLVAGVAALGCVVALVLGAADARGVAADEGSCIYADGMGVPGEGCGVQSASFLVSTMAADERGCVYADGFGVPGEGCGHGSAAILVHEMAADEPGCVYADASGVPGEGCGRPETR